MRHGTSSPTRALAAAALALALAPFAASASYAGTRQAGPVEVVGNAQNKFVPADVTATPDAKDEITVTFTVEGGVPHTWTNKALGIDTGIVNGGDSKTITFKAPPAGQHKIVCTLHEGQGMVGTLTVAEAGGEDPDESPTAAPSSQPPASASASATVGAGSDDAPTQGAEDDGGEVEEAGHEVPGIAGNDVLRRIEEERAAQEGAVSGFKFFTFVCVAFLFILGAAVLFSTRPRRSGR